MTQRRAFHLRTQALAHLAVEEAEGFDLEAEGHGGVQQGGQQALVLHQRVVNAPLLQGQLGQRHTATLTPSPQGEHQTGLHNGHDERRYTLLLHLFELYFN